MSKDSLTSHLEKSIISSILTNARASLKEPSRPFTPADVQRALFSNPDRPPSSYSIKSLSKDLEPIRPKQVVLDGPLQVKRKIMTDENKVDPRKPVKAQIIENEYEEIGENEELNQLKNLVFILDQMKVHSEARQLYQKEDLQDLLNEISSCLQKLKYVEIKPAWAAVEEVMRNLALTLERFENETEKIMKIGKCLLDNITVHEILYKKGKKSISINSLAAGSLKILYQFSKKKENDLLFLEEKLVETLYVLLINIVSEDTYLEIDLPYDFLIFLLGILKNISNNKSISDRLVNFINPLSTLLPTPLIDVKAHKNPKHGHLLVQVSGILSNLSGRCDLQELIVCQVVEKVTLTLDLYRESEVILNCVKCISRVSLESIVCTTLSFHIRIYIKHLYEQENPLILARVCYIVANVLTLKEATREDCDKIWVNRLLDLSSNYISSTEHLYKDLLLKVIRLIANIISCHSIGQKINCADSLCKLLTDVLSSHSVQDHEELVLNTVACLTNLLYFDQPNTDFLSENSRILAFSKLPPILVSNFNEELTVETLRALGNLTRHEAICRELNSMYMLDIFLMLLDHSNTTILYYDLGCLINVSSVSKEMLYCEKYFDGLITLLASVFIYEIDISCQILMVLTNLCTPAKGMVPWESVAGEESVKRLASQVKDMLSEVSKINTEEEELEKLRKILTGIEKLMPKPLIPCSFTGCGRKFATEELLKDHWDRRHS